MENFCDIIFVHCGVIYVADRGLLNPSMAILRIMEDMKISTFRKKRSIMLIKHKNSSAIRNGRAVQCISPRLLIVHLYVDI